MLKDLLEKVTIIKEYGSPNIIFIVSSVTVNINMALTIIKVLSINFDISPYHNYYKSIDLITIILTIASSLAIAITITITRALVITKI